MNIYRKADNTVIPQGLPFTIGDLAFAGNWLALASPDELAAQGITVEVVPDPEPNTPRPEYSFEDDYGQSFASTIGV